MYKPGIVVDMIYIPQYKKSQYKLNILFISFSGNEYSSYGTGNIYLVSSDSNTNDLFGFRYSRSKCHVQIRYNDEFKIYNIVISL